MQSDQGIKPSNSQSLKPSNLPNALLTLSTNGTSSLDTSSESTVVPDSIPKIDLNPTSVQPSLFYNASLGLCIHGASLSIILSNLLPSLFPTLVSFNPSLLFEIQELGGATFHIMFQVLFQVLLPVLFQLFSLCSKSLFSLKCICYHTLTRFYFSTLCACQGSRGCVVQKNNSIVQSKRC